MENKSIKILAIDDNPDDLIALKELINKAYRKAIYTCKLR